MIRVGIITASDKGCHGEREDLSGAKIAEIMEQHGYEIAKKVILPDDQQMLSEEMVAMSEDNIQLVLTTNFTIFSDYYRTRHVVTGSSRHPRRNIDHQLAGQSEGSRRGVELHFAIFEAWIGYFTWK